MFMRAESYINRKTQQPDYTATGYYISEKFDGQRAQWDPVRKILISRYGNTINCPTWFYDYFTDLTEPVDGELFMGYGNWDLTGIFRATKPDEDLWQKVKYIVFDIADEHAGNFLVRRARLEQICSTRWHDNKHVRPVPIMKALSKEHIQQEFKKVIARGGEGIMLNNPYHAYCDGKTAAILKYKNVMDDECVIVGYKMGNGRLTGKLGSFIVHPIEDGKPIRSREFSLAGINEHIRDTYTETHKIGTVLNYRCAEFTKDGKPKHPVYIGICRKPVTNTCMITEQRIRPESLELPALVKEPAPVIPDLKTINRTGIIPIKLRPRAL